MIRRLLGFVVAPLLLGGGVAVAETITWQRVSEAKQPTAWVVMPGQVVLTRAPGNLPLGMTAEQLATKLAQQERDLAYLQQQQLATKQETKEYAKLQADLARAEAEKEAIARSMAASTQHVATQTAATEARLREQLVAQYNQTVTNELKLREALAAQERNLATFSQRQQTALQETKEYAKLQAQLAQAQAEKEAIARSMAASTQHVATQAAATEARLREQLVAQSSQTVKELTGELQGYTQAQVAQLRQQTGQFVQQRVAQSQAEAIGHAAQLARLEAAHVANRLESKVAEISATRVKPEEASRIAAQQLVEAKPEFQVLALQTLGQAKPYLQTIARSAVADADPGMQQALGKAVGKALADEASPAAFRMRKAIVDELAAVSQGAISATVPTAMTRLGDDVEPGAGPEESLDAARLRLGRLLEPGAGPQQVAKLEAPRTMSLQRARTRTDLMNLRDYKVVVHEDGQTLPQMFETIMARAEPFTGPWQVRWKLKAENQDLLTEKFSLDAETTFAEFVSHLAQYLLNDRGVKLSFALFDRERVMLVSD